MIARVRPGVALARAQQEVHTIVPPLRDRFPWRMAADFGQNAITAVSIGRPAILLLTPLMTLDVPAGYSSGSVVNSSG